MKRIAFCMLLLAALQPATVLANWQVITQTDTDTNVSTQVAYTDNEAGFSLEIYRDGVNAVRARFSINRALDRLLNTHCPTFQIDNRLLDKRSINDAFCITEISWSEFIPGDVVNNTVNSEKLNALISGRIIMFRFMLENGSYEEAHFSLAGSKRATLTLLGGDVLIPT